MGRALLKAIVVRVNADPVVEDVGSDLDSLQRLVDGNIEMVRINDHLHLYCDEEGKLKGKPANRLIPHDVLCGDFVVLRATPDGEEASVVPEVDLPIVANLFRRR